MGRSCFWSFPFSHTYTFCLAANMCLWLLIWYLINIISFIKTEFEQDYSAKASLCDLQQITLRHRLRRGTFGPRHISLTKKYDFGCLFLVLILFFPLGFVFVFRRNPFYLFFLLEFKIRSLSSKTKDKRRRKSFSYPFQSLSGNFKEKVIWKKFSFLDENAFYS